MILGIIVLIVIITLVSLLGSLYARKYGSADGLIGLYVAFVLISNILGYKIAEFDLGFASFYAPSAVIIFSVTFLITDIVNEKFGRKETQKMILIAFLAQIVSIMFILITIYLKPAPFWTDQENFVRIMGFAPRIIVASLISFIISENLDAYLFSWFKAKTNGNHLWMRNAFSTIPSMALDTLVFVLIAFYGEQPVMHIFWGVLVIKWLVGIADIPFMYLNKRILK